MTAAETLALAQSLLKRPDTRIAGLWPRAAALLGRQALEQGLDDYWRAKGVSLESLATRPQLICLSRYLCAQNIATKTSYTWAALTGACHHHPYELPASHAELKSWLAAVAEALVAMGT